MWKSVDLGAHWVNCNTGLGIAQFYTVGLHPSDPDAILGGTQDNGTVRYTGSLAWPEVIAGDGGPTVYEWSDPAYYYSTYIFMTDLYRWNGLDFDADVSGPWEAQPADRADWCNSPLISDPGSPNRLLAGTYRVYESLTRGDSWTLISGDLTGGPNGVLRALAVAPTNPGTLYAGSSDGYVYVTVTGGAFWNLRNAGLPAQTVSDIVVDPTFSEHAYVSLDVMNGSRVWRTNDAGEGWVNATGDLPPNLRGMSLAADWRTSPERLYLGTDYGVYSSRDSGDHWEPAGTGLPNNAVYDLAVDGVNSWLVAATHGRSMWRAFVDAQGPAVTVHAPDGGEAWPLGSTRTITWTATDVSGIDSVTILLSTDGGTSYTIVIASGIPNSASYAWTVTGPLVSTCRVQVIAHDHAINSALDASNADFTISSPLAVGEVDTGSLSLAPVRPHPTRTPATITFTLPRRAEVTLQIFDLQGRLVRELERGPRSEGRHAVSWDGHDANGQRVMSGVYLYRLNASGVALTRRMVVVK